MAEFLAASDQFLSRHIGPREQDMQTMLAQLGYQSLEELTAAVVPKQIRMNKDLALDTPLSEAEFLDTAWQIAQKNKVFRSYIGMGYYDTLTPPVILRNVLENPLWYTAYTPYQAEISQGRMAALLNFQTMVMDLTGLDLANASLLDEATAAAEAMMMCYQLQGKTKGPNFFVANNCHPQTIEVLRTRALPLGIELLVGDPEELDFQTPLFGVLLQYPTTGGAVCDYKALIERAHQNKVMVVMAADLLALTLFQSPGEMGADVAVGSTQRFGVPMGFGGPHAAYFATRDAYKRAVPGRIIGVSVDAEGAPALRLALQTREQHIRREKATSNICTAQVLLAVMASFYACYHGPEGLKSIAWRIKSLTDTLALGLERLGIKIHGGCSFDTLTLPMTPQGQGDVRQRALSQGVNLRYYPCGSVGVSLNETTTLAEVDTLLEIFAGRSLDGLSAKSLQKEVRPNIPETLKRTSAFLQQKVFNSYHSETDMLRYITELGSKDLSLAHAMIPLGSCTMKLNATTEMIPVTWPEFSRLHPFAPLDQVQGSLTLIHQLEEQLARITGFARVSLQPNAGSQGEYAGLLVIRKYHQSRGESHRNICLIPSSAHGTNPASAAMAGMRVVVVQCDPQGNVDIEDLRAKAKTHSAELAALMVTYPSTHGVFEEGISDICAIVHEHGGQVYMDGANMNAMVGLCQPGAFGADVCHLNLHKTFCIPHGGGGPGVGPIAVGQHLRDFLPTHSLVPEAGPANGISAVSAAPWGSAGILAISWAYIRLMGAEGLKRASQVAILNANYIAHRLGPHYPVVYRGRGGRVAHECIIDIRPLEPLGIKVEDVAKRLIDFGFHAPTMSWPVIGTLMIEPTESESKQEIDRFCEAMIAIRDEAREIEQGRVDRDNNVLKNAPHTLYALTSSHWDRPYSREKAAYPLGWVRHHKVWPAVSRVNNAHGDRHLVCSCAPFEEEQSSGERA